MGGLLVKLKLHLPSARATAPVVSDYPATPDEAFLDFGAAPLPRLPLFPAPPASPAVLIGPH